MTAVERQVVLRNVCLDPAIVTDEELATDSETVPYVSALTSSCIALIAGPEDVPRNDGNILAPGTLHQYNLGALAKIKSDFLARIFCQGTDAVYNCRFKKYSEYCTIYFNGDLYFTGLDNKGILDRWLGWIAYMHQQGIKGKSLENYISAVKYKIAGQVHDLSVLDCSRGGSNSTYLQSIYRKSSYTAQEKRDRGDESDATKKVFALNQ